jgi:hypothetical protein
VSGRVRIDRVEVRLRGSEGAARGLARELPAALESQLRPRSAAGRVDRVEAPPVRLAPGAPAHSAAAAVAVAVARGLARGEQR